MREEMGFYLYPSDTVSGLQISPCALWCWLWLPLQQTSSECLKPDRSDKQNDALNSFIILTRFWDLELVFI